MCNEFAGFSKNWGFYNFEFLRLFRLFSNRAFEFPNLWFSFELNDSKKTKMIDFLLAVAVLKKKLPWTKLVTAIAITTSSTNDYKLGVIADAY